MVLAAVVAAKAQKRFPKLVCVPSFCVANHPPGEPCKTGISEWFSSRRVPHSRVKGAVTVVEVPNGTVGTETRGVSKSCIEVGVAVVPNGT